MYLDYLRRLSHNQPINEGVALSCSFKDLMDVTLPIHGGDKVWIDRLHDVWISYGAFTPDSYNHNALGEHARIDVRRNQLDEGIALKRIVPRPAFIYWFVECASEKGLAEATPLIARTAYFMICNAFNTDYRLQIKRMKRR